MKSFKPLAALWALLLATPASAGDPDLMHLAKRYSDNNCAWCHGPSLQGLATAPRIAGQRAGYLESQLHEFKLHHRDGPVAVQFMWGAVTPIHQEGAKALADYISSMQAESAGNGNSDLAARGRDLYMQGAVGEDIPSCAVCHAPNAEGAGAIPRLDGLSYGYLKRRLEEWGAGYHATAAYPMPRVARKLSDEQIAAISSYLSLLGAPPRRNIIDIFFDRH